MGHILYPLIGVTACLSLYSRLAPHLDQVLAGKQRGDGLSSRGCGIPPLDEPCINLFAYSPSLHNCCNCVNYYRYAGEDGTLGSRLIEPKIQRLTKWLENYHLWRTSRLGFEVMQAFAQTTFRSRTWETIAHFTREYSWWCLPSERGLGLVTRWWDQFSIFLFQSENIMMLSLFY